MTDLRTPTNTNFLPQTDARMVLLRAPTLTFFLQDITIPAMQLAEATFETQLDRIPWPGDRLRRSTLDVQFKVDEDAKNYLEIWNWMVGLAAPDSYEQYADLVQAGGSTRGYGVFSDLTITVADSARRSNLEFTFQDTWPTALGALQFSTKGENIVPLDVAVSFNFRHFTIKKS